METPVLNKLQKKLSLSAKKQKKETMKNIVANPHTSYWPFVDGSKELKSALAQNMPIVRIRKINVPWNIIKNTTKEDRRSVRNEYLKKNSPPNTAVVEPNLVFGVNEVAKSLETNSCSSVLVAAVNPRLLVQHILDLAVLHRVPILVVQNLKQMLERHCGLGSIAMAIKRSHPEGSSLSKIVDVITELSKNYPVDEEHINAKRNLEFQHAQSEEEQEEDVIQTKDVEAHKKEICHLFRTSSKCRAFVPKISNETCVESKNSMEFISFDDTEVVNSKNESNGASYKPLVVKRLKSNKNRAKNKVEQLKRKRK